jgi:uncharacterized protein (DUF58 family)
MLTGLGRTLAGCVLGLFAAGWALGYPELAVVGTGGVLALAVGLGLVVRRTSLQVRRELIPDRVARGEPAVASLHVQNVARLSSPRLSAVDPCGPRQTRVALPRLRPGASREVSYRLPTERRGVFPVGPLQVDRSDPLGLWRRWQRFDQSAVLRVHPVVLPLPVAPSGRRLHLDGPQEDSAPRGTVTFDGLRAYVPGDDQRHVHWRSSVRLGTLMVRVHVDPSLPLTTVLLDTRRALHGEESFEDAVEAVASITVGAALQRYPVRLRTTCGETVDCHGRREDARALLDMLAGVQLVDHGGFDAITSLLAKARGGTLVVVTGRCGRDDLAAVARVRSRFERAIVLRIGAEPLEMAAVAVDLPVLSCADTVDFAFTWNALVRPG